jgi:hypothetical protein
MDVASELLQKSQVNDSSISTSDGFFEKASTMSTREANPNEII